MGVETTEKVHFRPRGRHDRNHFFREPSVCASRSALGAAVGPRRQVMELEEVGALIGSENGEKRVDKGESRVEGLL